MGSHQAAGTKSVEEFAQVLGVSSRILYNRCVGSTINLGDDQIRVIRVGRRIRVPDIEIDRLLGVGQTSPAQDRNIADHGDPKPLTSPTASAGRHPNSGRGTGASVAEGEDISSVAAGPGTPPGPQAA